MLDLTRTISIIEVIWVSVVGISLIFHLLTLRDVQLDRKYLRESGTNGMAHIVANANVRSERLRSTVAACLLFAGVVSLFRESPPSIGGPDFDLARVLVILAFIGAASLMTFSSILDRRDRKRIVTFRGDPELDIERMVARKAGELVIQTTAAAHDQAVKYVQEEEERSRREESQQ